MKSSRRFVLMAVVAVVCLVVGGSFVFIGKAMGGYESFSQNGNLNFNLLSIGNKRYKGALDNKTIALESFDTLDIDLSMMEFVIQQGDEASLKLTNVPADTLQITQNSNDLRIYNSYERLINYQFGDIDNKAILTIPYGQLELVNIELSMGVLNISSIQTKQLTVESSMTSIDIKDLSSLGLQIESSMADINVSGTLLGITKIQNSMGNVELNIVGNKQAYAYQLSNSMGALNYDNISLEGLGSNTKGNSQAENSITIDSSMGNVDIRFR